MRKLLILLMLIFYYISVNAQVDFWAKNLGDGVQLNVVDNQPIYTVTKKVGSTFKIFYYWDGKYHGKEFVQKQAQKMTITDTVNGVIMFYNKKYYKNRFKL